MKNILLVFALISFNISNAAACAAFECDESEIVDVQKDYRQPNGDEIARSIRAEKSYLFSFRDYMKDASNAQALIDACIKVSANYSSMAANKVKTLYTQQSYARSANEIKGLLADKKNSDQRDEVFNLFMKNI